MSAIGSDATNASGGRRTLAGEPSAGQGIESRTLSPQTTHSSDQNSDTGISRAISSSNSTAPAEEFDQTLKFVAICVNTGTTRTLEEVEVSKMTTDKQLFDLMNKAYRDVRGWRTKLHFLIRPSDMQYVQVSQLVDNL